MELFTLIIVAIIFFYLYFQKIVNQKEHEQKWFKKSINGDLYKYHTYADNVPFIRNGVKSVESVTSYKEGKIHGVFREFNMEGKETLSIEFKDGKKNGVYKKYSQLGNPTEIKHYVNDELNGVFREFDMEGKETLSIEYKDGKKNGVYKKYSEGGGLLEIKHYVNDELNGVYRLYDANGVVIKRVIYKDNLKVDDDIAYCNDLYSIIADNIEKTVELRTYMDDVDHKTRIDGIALALQANVDSLLAIGESPNRFSIECFIGNMVNNRGGKVASLNIEYVFAAWNIVGVNPISCEEEMDIRDNPFTPWPRKKISETK
jgi:antitoxin component YwqK of YwqJK toxin-antitoxin module